MTANVSAAIEEIKAAFPGYNVSAEPDDDGGARMEIQDMPIGEQYRPAKSWIGFHITFQYPHADVYPHFCAAGLARADGKALGIGLGEAQWRGKASTQISRRSNHLDPSNDTAAMKLAKVITWLRNHEGA